MTKPKPHQINSTSNQFKTNQIKQTQHQHQHQDNTIPKQTKSNQTDIKYKID